MSITVHHLEYSRSLRILWLLEELELDYAIERYARDKNFRAPPSLERVHPLGRAPAVEVDGQVLVESGAVIQHFVELHGRLGPSKPEDRARFLFWLHYPEGSAMPPLLVRLIFDRMKAAKLPFFVKPIVKGIVKKVDGAFTGPELARHLGFIDAQLATGPYVLGDTFSAADIQLLYTVEAGLARGCVPMPHAEAWLTRVKQRPAYQRAEAKGGPAVPPPRHLDGG
jgi:glutathione S-transferase